MSLKSILLLLLSGISTVSFAQIQSPEEFLITQYGEKFTPHHLLVEYVYHLAEESEYMTIEKYGYTYEKRPLLLATFTSPENRTDLDNIRKTNLYNTGILTTPPDQMVEKAIVWLSFGVHGNEAGGPESSMNVMYKLANPDAEVKSWLENAVVLIDPSVNPDGFSRYTHWMWREGGKEIHPEHDDREHMEPWPVGRVNHYLFDLNRDWAWQTQIESQQRIVKYNEWFPHVHVDFHEMGHNNHYYFAPAAKPYHQYITDWQKDFQEEIGRNNAQYFDEKGWMYFSREVFDLFYPSYGDTYPTYNGAIGMTYEKAGNSRAGRAILMNNGDTLTIRDRIDHHTTTALSTIEVSVSQKDQLIENFKKYYIDNKNNPKGKYRAYVLKKSENQEALADLLKRNFIDFSYVNGTASATGFYYQSQSNKNFFLTPGDIIIDVKQPKSTLIQVLLEPEHELEDSLTYDITAWSLPYAYGVETYGLSGIPEVSVADDYMQANLLDCSDENYAYYFAWGSHDAHAALSGLMKEKVHLRISQNATTFDGQEIGKDYVVAIRGDNPHLKDFDKIVQEVIREISVEKGCLSTGFSNQGRDLGGSNFELLKNPRILTISGERVGTNSFGQIWHYFEQHMDYPVSIVDIDNLGRVDLGKFDVFILPDGYYSLSDNQMSEIGSWVNRGGKLIAIGGALRLLSDKEGYALARYATDEEKKAAEKAAKDKELTERKESYEGQERRRAKNFVPGAIIRNEIDNSHPLAAGIKGDYYSLKTSSATYSLLKDAWNVVYIPEDINSYGFIGSELKQKLGETVSFAVEEKGRGQVVYMVDNPLYRGFWHMGLHLFTNAVFIVN